MRCSETDDTRTYIGGLSVEVALALVPRLSSLVGSLASRVGQTRFYAWFMFLVYNLPFSGTGGEIRALAGRLYTR